MATLENPASLNAFQQYRQACSILKDTSRAVVSTWYQEALELDFQFHILVDGVSVHSFFYERSKNEWSSWKNFSEEVLTDSGQTKRFALELLKQVRSLKGTSVGVVVHAADEFATAELKPELDNPADLSNLREAAYHNPGEILEDSSIPPDQASWRVLPYPASGSEVIGTTITMSRHLEGFVTTLRSFANEVNFPIITHVLSAPLVSIMALSEVITPTPRKPFIAILQYPGFTAVAFFNEHSDLRLIRTLQHRGLRRPPHLDHALSTSMASLEFEDPDIYILALAEGMDPKLSEELAKSFPASVVETTEYPTVAPIPEWAPGPSLVTKPAKDAGEAGDNGKQKSYTFGVLRAEKWFLQDFLPPSAEEAALFPSRNEMRLLRYFKLGRYALAAIVLLGIAWAAMSIFSVTNKPEWAFNEADATAVTQRLTNLNQERQRVDHWNNLLSDRSKAWSSMEALAQLFPDKSGLLVKTYNHMVRPDSVPGQAKVGFVKEWVITGMARDEALAYLNSLNTREGISTFFSQVAEVTGDLAYDPTPTTRSIVVNVRTQENAKFRQRPIEEIDDSDESTYPFTFNLTITQRFESADPMAISAAKAP